MPAGNEPSASNRRKVSYDTPPIIAIVSLRLIKMGSVVGMPISENQKARQRWWALRALDELLRI